MITFLDLETRSGADLKKTGVHRYVEDEHFTVLIMGYAIGDAPAVALTDPDEMRAASDIILGSPGHIVAHNAPFDRIALGAFLGRYLDHRQWIDTRVIAAEHGYPGSLADLAAALGVQLKDTAGTRLINMFSKPARNGSFTEPEDKPEHWKQFCDYAIGDVESLREAYYALPAQSEQEREVELVDQRVNDRGIRIDLDLARAAIDSGQRSSERAKREIIELTGVDNPGSVQQLLDWFEKTGEPLPNLQAATVRERLETEVGDRRRVLELRQDISLASHKKFTAAYDRACSDGRVRGAFFYGGAHTLRWAGRGLQLQNLPRASLGEAEDDAIQRLLTTGQASSEELKALVRPMMLGPFTIADYSAIEARVIAWLAGEQWALDAFEAGRDIYVETAERMGGDMTRQDGKTATLGLGYGGTVQALRNVGATGDDDHLTSLVTKWRNANQRIVKFWSNMSVAFLRGGRVGRISVRVEGDNRFLTLPSGRVMSYRNVQLVQGKFGAEALWHSPRGPKRMWGGLLAENVTQATARDLLAAALVRIDAAGYPIVGHVHDEVIVEGECAQLSDLMCERPSWAPDLPLDAEQEYADRYRK